MKYAEEVKAITEMLNFHPGSYVMTYRDLHSDKETDNKFAFSPVQHARARLYGTRREVNERWLPWLVQYKRDHPYYLIEGQRMEPLFRWPKELLKEGVENELKDLLREAVHKKEGSFAMYDASPGEAILQIGREGGIIYAKVKSKSREGVPYTVVIRKGFLTDEGDIDLKAVACGCEEHIEAKKKSEKYVINMVCLHTSLVLDEHTLRRLNPDTRKRKMKGSYPYVERAPFNPFTFAENWVRKGNMLVPISRHRAMLEWDMNIAYYLFDETMAGINYKVFQLPNECSQAVKRSVVRDEITFEFMRHGAVKIDDSFRGIVEAEKEAVRSLYSYLYKFGYGYECYSAEMGRPAIRLENKNNVVTIIPGRKEKGKTYVPPVYTVRSKPKGGMTEESMCQVYNGERNPFRLLNSHQNMLDDYRKVETRTVIRPLTRLWVPEMPGEAPRIELPEPLENSYIQAIERYSQNAAKDMRISGLRRR